MARIGIKVVGTKACFHQLVGGVAFPDGPLAGAEHAYGAWAALLERGLVLLLHDVKGLFPGYRLELALLVVLAVLHPQQRLGQAIAAVHDLRQEVALDAVDAAVDLGLDVAVGSNDLVVAGTDHDATTCAAEAAGRFVPTQIRCVRFGDQVGGAGGDGYAGGAGSNGSSIGFGKLTTGEAHQASPSGVRS